MNDTLLHIDLKNALKGFKITALKGHKEGSLVFQSDFTILTIEKSNDNNKVFKVNFISTLKNERRKGYASQLFKLVKNALKSLGYQLQHSNSTTIQGTYFVNSLKGLNQ